MYPVRCAPDYGHVSLGLYGQSRICSDSPGTLGNACICCMQTRTSRCTRIDSMHGGHHALVLSLCTLGTRQAHRYVQATYGTLMVCQQSYVQLRPSFTPCSRGQYGDLYSTFCYISCSPNPHQYIAHYLAAYHTRLPTVQRSACMSTADMAFEHPIPCLTYLTLVHCTITLTAPIKLQHAARKKVAPAP